MGRSANCGSGVAVRSRKQTVGPDHIQAETEIGGQAGLIQRVSQSFLPWLGTWGDVDLSAAFGCPKAFLPLTIST